MTYVCECGKLHLVTYVVKKIPGFSVERIKAAECPDFE